MARRKSRKNRIRSFFQLHHFILHSPEWAELSPRAVKLLIDVGASYRGNNNGDLSCAFSVLKKRGWTSNDQLRKALSELLDRGWLLQTRKGGFPKLAALYALSFLPLNASNKHDFPEEPTARHTWQKENPRAASRTYIEPPHGPMKLGNSVENKNRATTRPCMGNKNHSIGPPHGQLSSLPGGRGQGQDLSKVQNSYFDHIRRCDTCQYNDKSSLCKTGKRLRTQYDRAWFASRRSGNQQVVVI